MERVECYPLVLYKCSDCDRLDRVLLMPRAPSFKSLAICAETDYITQTKKLLNIQLHPSRYALDAGHIKRAARYVFQLY